MSLLLLAFLGPYFRNRAALKKVLISAGRIMEGNDMITYADFIFRDDLQYQP